MPVSTCVVKQCLFDRPRKRPREALHRVLLPRELQAKVHQWQKWRRYVLFDRADHSSCRAGFRASAIRTADRRRRIVEAFSHQLVNARVSRAEDVSGLGSARCVTDHRDGRRPREQVAYRPARPAAGPDRRGSHTAVVPILRASTSRLRVLVCRHIDDLRVAVTRKIRGGEPVDARP